MKYHDSNGFSSEFGHGFETYLTYSLDSLKINFLREFDIRKTFNVKNSVLLSAIEFQKTKNYFIQIPKNL